MARSVAITDGTSANRAWTDWLICQGERNSEVSPFAAFGGLRDIIVRIPPPETATAPPP